MLKGLLTLVCLLWILDPSASAQSAGRPVPIGVYSETAGRPAHIAVYSEVVSENLCAPDGDGAYEEITNVALDDSQLAKLRIELLERGLDPGFDPDALDAEARLAETIRIFQAKFSLPVTGQADAATLFMLSVSIQNSSKPYPAR
jgi:hypothetical protein